MTAENDQQKYEDAVRAFCDPPTAYQQRKLHARRGRELFVGDYLVVDRLGKGAMSLVYKAVNRRSGQPRALKVLAKSFHGNPARVMLMKREAGVAMAVTHPNVVRTYAVEVERTPYYIAMELLAGRSLDEILQERKYLAPAEAVGIVRLVAHALQAIDEAGFVHGDVKPSNIFVSNHGRVKLTDFGLAHLYGQNEAFRKRGYVLGTGFYLAPEVAALQRTNDIRSDLYSLGVVLYQMLTGIVPFPASTRSAALERHIDDDLPNIRAVWRDLPDPVADLVDKLMAKRSADRYQTPAELIAALSPVERTTAWTS